MFANAYFLFGKAALPAEKVYIENVLGALFSKETYLEFEKAARGSSPQKMYTWAKCIWNLRRQFGVHHSRKCIEV